MNYIIPDVLDVTLGIVLGTFYHREITKTKGNSKTIPRYSGLSLTTKGLEYFENITGLSGALIV